MNTKEPYDILGEAKMRELPLQAQRDYVPIPPSAARVLQHLPPELRKKWLDANRHERRRIVAEERSRLKAALLARERAL